MLALDALVAAVVLCVFALLACCCSDRFVTWKDVLSTDGGGIDDFDEEDTIDATIRRFPNIGDTQVEEN